MMSLKDAMGRKVVARDTAEQVGSATGAVVDVAARRIVALQVGKGHGPFRGGGRLADWDALTGVGPDAVVVESESALRDPAGEREQSIVKGDIPLLGGRVLTDRGDELGPLDDLEFDEGSGEVLALAVGGATIGADRLRAIGSYALVVGAGADDPPARG